jgi:hypothetical protein
MSDIQTLEKPPTQPKKTLRTWNFFIFSFFGGGQFMLLQELNLIYEGQKEINKKFCHISVEGEFTKGCLTQGLVDS